MWSNIARKRNGQVSENAPDYTCADRQNCGHVIWPEKGGRQSPQGTNGRQGRRASNQDTSVPSCPSCGGRMWDNRPGKADGSRSPKTPDFACRDRKGCGDAIWNEADVEGRASSQRASADAPEREVRRPVREQHREPVEMPPMWDGPPPDEPCGDDQWEASGPDWAPEEVERHESPMPNRSTDRSARASRPAAQSNTHGSRTSGLALSVSDRSLLEDLARYFAERAHSAERSGKISVAALAPGYRDSVVQIEEMLKAGALPNW